ncbi:hypothetical protein JTY60_00420 [symbiont of Argiope bruennichi]|uniref:hypothetical protein n=1 Tax=symbiont of Argiope bruennichi TaxID=2810479 RepID=UPI003DA3D613
MFKNWKIKKKLFCFNWNILLKSFSTFLIFWSTVWIFSNTFFGPIFAYIPMKLTNCQQWNTCLGNVKSALLKNQLNSAIIDEINSSEQNVKLKFYGSILTSQLHYENFHAFLKVNEGNHVPHYKISTYFFLNNNNNNKWIIMTHGISCDWTYSFLFALSFFKNYNVILYDSYGVNSEKKDSFGNLGTSGNCSTFGKYEQYGLHTIVKWIYNMNKSAEIGLFGLSMGASTTLLYLENFHDESSKLVKFAISDAAYKDAAEEMGYVGSSFVDIPSFFFTPGGSLYLSFFAGYNPYSINIIKNIKKIDKDKKLFFIQGSSDNFVPFKKNFYQLVDEAKKCKLDTDQLVEEHGTHGEDLSWNRSTIRADEMATDGTFYTCLDRFARMGFGE